MEIEPRLALRRIQQEQERMERQRREEIKGVQVHLYLKNLVENREFRKMCRYHGWIRCLKAVRTVYNMIYLLKSPELVDTFYEEKSSVWERNRKHFFLEGVGAKGR